MQPILVSSFFFFLLLSSHVGYFFSLIVQFNNPLQSSNFTFSAFCHLLSFFLVSDSCLPPPHFPSVGCALNTIPTKVWQSKESICVYNILKFTGLFSLILGSVQGVDPTAQSLICLPGINTNSHPSLHFHAPSLSYCFFLFTAACFLLSNSL